MGQKLARQTIFLMVVLAVSFLAMTYTLVMHFDDFAETAEAAPSRLTLAQIPFNGAGAYEYLQQICAIGQRITGSPGMLQQQKLLTEHFEKLGGKVSLQEFQMRHPQTGAMVTGGNLIVQWHPEKQERILLCAHYDTRPLPDQDKKNPKGVFIGANDGGSGVALLMQLAHDMRGIQGKCGVDFVLFDAEELVYRNGNVLGQGGDPYFVGSEHFAKEYVRAPHCKYRWGVLLDMVADADLQIYQEKNSMLWRDTRPLVLEIWKTAKRLDVREFIPQQKHEVRDDHLRLRNIGKIPTCDIIDFDYPYWHTEGDTPEHCSALSLAKVGWVVREWLIESVAK